MKGDFYTNYPPAVLYTKKCFKHGRCDIINKTENLKTSDTAKKNTKNTKIYLLSG